MATSDEMIPPPPGFTVDPAHSLPPGFSMDAAKPAFKGDPEGIDVAASRAKSFGKGITDPLTGAAQLLTHIAPDSFSEASNDLQNWFAKYGIMDKIPTKDAQGNPISGKKAFDEFIHQNEKKGEDERVSAGRGGADWFRLGGNVVSPANAAIASKIPQASGIAARIGIGMGQGAAQGALTPVTEGNFLDEKLKQIGIGGGVGGVLPALTGAAARIIKPITSKAAEFLAEKGVSLTPGQILGGWYQRVEDGLTSLPIIGDSIKGAQRRGIETFNTAAVNDALTPIGEKLPKGVEGQQALAYAREKLGDKYDALLPKLKGELFNGPPANAIASPGAAQQAIKPSFMDEIKTIRQMGDNLPPQQKKDLNRIIDKEIIEKFTKQGNASGETLKMIQEKLNKEAGNFATGDAYQRTLAGGIKELGSAMRRMIEDVNPGYSKELGAIDLGYATFKRAQRAGSGVGIKDGFFTPSQYNSAVKALDRTKDKRAFSEGDALGQDLASAGKKVLSQTVPDSGTPLRGLIGATALGGGAAAAHIPYAAGALAAPAIYSNLGTTAIQKALMNRPQFAQPLSDLVRKSNPALTAGAVPLAELMMSTQGQ